MKVIIIKLSLIAAAHPKALSKKFNFFRVVCEIPFFNNQISRIEFLFCWSRAK